MLINIGTVVGTSGKQNLWIADDQEELSVSLNLLTTNRGEKNGG